MQVLTIRRTTHPSVSLFLFVLISPSSSVSVFLRLCLCSPSSVRSCPPNTVSCGKEANIIQVCPQLATALLSLFLPPIHTQTQRHGRLNCFVLVGRFQAALFCRRSRHSDPIFWGTTCVFCVALFIFAAIWLFVNLEGVERQAPRQPLVRNRRGDAVCSKNFNGCIWHVTWVA